MRALKIGLIVIAGMLVGTSLAHCQERPRDTAFKLTAGLLAGLATVDVVQTSRCIQARRCTESNPIAKPIAGNPTALAVTKGAVVTATIAAAWSSRRTHPKLSKAVLWSMVGVQGLVVASNWNQLRKVR